MSFDSNRLTILLGAGKSTLLRMIAGIEKLTMEASPILVKNGIKDKFKIISVMYLKILHYLSI